MTEQPQKQCNFTKACKWITVETNLKCPVDNGNIKSCIYDTRSRPAPAAELRFNSEDLLLLANDEWKRREERRHIHDCVPWSIGFINGFLTDKKWAREYVDKLRHEGDYRCGDNCNGECSGEVDGKCNCPEINNTKGAP